MCHKRSVCICLLDKLLERFSNAAVAGPPHKKNLSGCKHFYLCLPKKVTNMNRRVKLNLSMVVIFFRNSFNDWLSYTFHYIVTKIICSFRIPLGDRPWGYNCSYVWFQINLNSRRLPRRQLLLGDPELGWRKNLMRRRSVSWWQPYKSLRSLWQIL